HYFSGGNFPIGGSARVFETMLPLITKPGGAVLVSAEVDEIIVEKNKAVGVRMKDGKEFRAKTIVSGAGIMTTYKTLLPPAIVEKHGLKKQLKKIKNSVAHACLYVGFEASPEKLQLPKANYWIYPSEGTHDECVDRYKQDINAEFPVVYVSFPAAKDPDWNNRYPNKSTVDIITLMPYEIFEQWEDTRWKKRGADYEALKEKISQRLLEALYKLEPQLKGKVAYYELSTPITTKHFINYEKGEIYGLDHSPDRFKNKFLRPHTPIKNLYLTGQDVVSAGVGAALFSGLITASAMTKKNFLKKIME
ncbi:MAG: phytoene desaturase family protein, partial [Chitinophagales bacterium]